MARIALYPDPLLAQVLAAAGYPEQILDAAIWADQHHYLSSPSLAGAIQHDGCPGDSNRSGNEQDAARRVEEHRSAGKRN